MRRPTPYPHARPILGAHHLLLLGVMASASACLAPDPSDVSDSDGSETTDDADGLEPSEPAEAGESTPSDFGGTAAASLGLYVATTGNDLADGSWATPWRTIQHAADVAPPGAEIRVLPGTYDERVTIRNSDLTFRGSQFGLAGQATVDATAAPFFGLGPYHPAFRIVNAKKVTITGFTITNHANPTSTECPEITDPKTSLLVRKCPINMGVLVLALDEEDPNHPDDFVPGEETPHAIEISNNDFTHVDRPLQGVSRGAIGIFVFGATKQDDRAVREVVIQDNTFFDNTMSADWGSNAILLHANVKDSIVRDNLLSNFGPAGPNPAAYVKGTIAIEAAGNDSSLDLGETNHARGIVISGNVIRRRLPGSPDPGGEVQGLYFQGCQRVLAERNYIEEAYAGINVATERPAEAADYTAEIWIRNNILASIPGVVDTRGADLQIGDGTWSSDDPTQHNDCYRPVRDVYVTNNTFHGLNKSNVPRVYMLPGILGDSAYRNNILRDKYSLLYWDERSVPPTPTAGSQCAEIPQPVAFNEMQIDDNLYYSTLDPSQTVGSYFWYPASQRKKWADYRALSGFDAHSTILAPNLANPSSPAGFTPLPGSPAIDAGDTVTPSWVTSAQHFGPFTPAVELDHYGNPRLAGPGSPPRIDLGAAEAP